MDRASSATTRRAFLTRLAVSSAAVLLTDLGSSATILAANDTPDLHTFLPDFAAGTLVAAAFDHISIHDPGYTPTLLPITLTAQTQICRVTCDADWHALQPGDRIETATYAGPGGEHVARWVNANAVFGMGTIRAITGTVLTITPWNPAGVERELTIDPHTTIHTQTDTGAGRLDLLHIGDDVHFTAIADDPDPSVRHIMGMTLHRMDKDAAPLAVAPQ